MENKNPPSCFKNKSCLIIFATIISVAAMVSWVYFSRVESANFVERYALHQEIVNGTAGSPYRYRVLVPYLTEAMLNAGIWLGLDLKSAFNLSYSIINLISIFFFLYFTNRFFRCFYSEKTSLIGILFIGCMIHIGLQDHYYQPWSLPESVFFVTALFLLKVGKIDLLWFLVFVAAFNRETAILIPALAFFTSLEGRGFGVNISQGRKLAAIFSAWLLVFLSLRFFLGPADHVISISQLIQSNLSKSGMIKAILNGSLILGAWWFILATAIRGKGLDYFLVRAWRILLIYLPLVLIFGVWAEVRLLIPLYPIAVASCLYLIEKEVSG